MKNNSSAWNLVIIFAPEDCPVCLDEISYWDKVTRSNNSIMIWGLINHKNKQLCEKFIASMGWKFPVHIDESIAIGENFSLRNTPIKILFNSDKKIVLVEGSNTQWMDTGRIKAFFENLNTTNPV